MASKYRALEPDALFGGVDVVRVAMDLACSSEGAVEIDGAAWVRRHQSIRTGRTDFRRWRGPKDNGNRIRAEGVKVHARLVQADRQATHSYRFLHCGYLARRVVVLINDRSVIFLHMVCVLAVAVHGPMVYVLLKPPPSPKGDQHWCTRDPLHDIE